MDSARNTMRYIKTCVCVHNDIYLASYRQTETTTRKFLTNLVGQLSNRRLLSRVLETKIEKCRRYAVPKVWLCFYTESLSPGIPDCQPIDWVGLSSEGTNTQVLVLPVVGHKSQGDLIFNLIPWIPVQQIGFNPCVPTNQIWAFCAFKRRLHKTEKS